MLSIGRRPTLNNGTDRSIEVHIFDFEQDVYHQTLRLSFVQYLRPVHSFPSIEALINQLSQDEQQARALLKNEKR
jgi:riboflavin kinase/FMN adenylyltransferase